MRALFYDALGQVINVLIWLSPTFVTFALGGLLLQRFYVTRANESAFIDSILKQLEELKADSLEYWNLDYANVGAREKGSILAQKIKGAIRALNSDLIHHKEKYGSKIDSSPLVTELMDACTSGEFEGSAKPVDTGRYIFIVNAVNKLRSELMRRKL